MKTRVRTITHTVTGLALLMALAACGGGGSFESGSSSGSGGSTSPTGEQLGSGSGTSFKSGVLQLSSASISAGGSATITVTAVDKTGALLSGSTSISFNSNCLASGLATITDSTGAAATTTTTTTGTAIVTYTAKGCSGSDTITATATVGTSKVSASGTLTVAAAALGSIQFVSASPSIITLHGMGGAGLQQTSTVIFTVKDSVGGPVSGADVKLSLVSSTGGVQLSQTDVSSDANGNVQTIVLAGTHSGPVTVQASILVSGSTISTTSSGLAIQSGIPSQSHFSLSLSSFNPEGFDVDNNAISITASMADRFGNPVPDGTTVSFTQSGFQFGAGGRVDSSCQTTSGTCSVTWHSQDPRPTTIANNQHVGFAYVLAFATGEESFTDTNGDGVFDDVSGGAEPFSSIAEIYAPSGEFTGTAPFTVPGPYVSGDNFNDFNSDGIHNNKNGTWEGVNCKEIIDGDCGTAKSAGVGNYACIVMSGSVANFSNLQVNGSASGTLTITGPGSVSADISDENGNVLPAGTIISVDTTNLQNGAATLAPANTGSTFVVGNTSCAGSVASWPATFVVNITQTGATAVGGTIALNVKTPGGVVASTTTTITITVQ